MIIDLGLLIGLISIALALFFGRFFGLRGFSKGISNELSNLRKNTEPIGEIKDKISVIGERVIAIQGTTEKAWDLMSVALAKRGTVERNLDNLGKVKITAEPAADKTLYLIEIEKPILNQGYLVKISKETELAVKENELFGKEGPVLVLSANRMRYSLPSTDPKTCTDFITFLLKWLNSTYVNSLDNIKEFEETILT